MHLKIPLLSRGLKLSNSKPPCQVSALQIVVKNIPPMAFWHRAHSDKCFLRFFFQNQPLFQCWKAKLGLKSSRNLATPANDYLHIYTLWIASLNSKKTGMMVFKYDEWDHSLSIFWNFRYNRLDDDEEKRRSEDVIDSSNVADTEQISQHRVPVNKLLLRKVFNTARLCLLWRFLSRPALAHMNNNDNLPCQ